MSERYRVFFCEFVAHHWRLSGHCDCGAENVHYYGRLQDNSELGDYPEAWPGKPCQCGKLPEVGSRTGRAVYRRTDTGQEVNPNGEQLPPGAVYAMESYSRTGPDGRYLICVTPGGHWHIDSRCSNCTRKDDDVHRCWVRHGRPEDGTLHVDKKGDTCSAGAGSILMRDGWHGFLHNGELYRC